MFSVHGSGFAARFPGGKEHQDEPHRQHGRDDHCHDGELDRWKCRLWILHGDRLPFGHEDDGIHAAFPLAGCARGSREPSPGRIQTVSINN
jgi:hypothetical protein